MTNKLVETFNLKLTMDRDRNVAELEKLLALVKTETLEQRFRRIGMEWMPGKYEFYRACKAASVAHDRLNESGGYMMIHPGKVTYLEVRGGEELGKPGTVRISISQPYPLPSFECYVPTEWFIEEWEKRSDNAQ
jgi:hypothetical protein